MQKFVTEYNAVRLHSAIPRNVGKPAVRIAMSEIVVVWLPMTILLIGSWLVRRARRRERIAAVVEPESPKGR